MLTNKQVNASFLPSVANGQAHNPFARAVYKDIVMFVPELGVPSEYGDMPSYSGTHNGQIVRALVAPGLMYDGNPDTVGSFQPPE
jgi:hypothetical protein